MLADHQLLWLGVQTLSWDKTRDLTSISIWERDGKGIRRVMESLLARLSHLSMELPGGTP